jgi:hypothetical protein
MKLNSMGGQVSFEPIVFIEYTLSCFPVPLLADETASSTETGGFSGVIVDW